MFYGICTAACMGTGYLVGPTLGAFIWRFLPSSKRYGSLIDKKDKEFYERIAKNRVDVTLQSPTSPVPDYYGDYYSLVFTTVKTDANIEMQAKRSVPCMNIGRSVLYSFIHECVRLRFIEI